MAWAARFSEVETKHPGASTPPTISLAPYWFHLGGWRERNYPDSPPDPALHPCRRASPPVEETIGRNQDAMKASVWFNGSCAPKDVDGRKHRHGSWDSEEKRKGPAPIAEIPGCDHQAGSKNCHARRAHKACNDFYRDFLPCSASFKIRGKSSKTGFCSTRIGACTSLSRDSASAAEVSRGGARLEIRGRLGFLLARRDQLAGPGSSCLRTIGQCAGTGRPGLGDATRADAARPTPAKQKSRSIRCR